MPASAQLHHGTVRTHRRAYVLGVALTTVVVVAAAAQLNTQNVAAAASARARALSRRQ